MAGASDGSPCPENTFESQTMTSTSAMQEHTPNLGSKTTLSLKNDPTFLAVTQLGYDESVVEYVIKKKIKETGCAFSKTASLLEAVVKHIKEIKNQQQADIYFRQSPETILSHSINPTVMSVVLSGYDQFTVDYVFRKKRKETGSAFPNASLLLEAVIKHIKEAEGQEQTKIDSKHDDKLKEENRLLKEERICKICFDKEKNVVFLPCGHLLSCAACANLLKTCPCCHSQILSLIKTYRS